jgi:lipoprotein-anchoring transpeptidase ErfK/SrfK
MALCLVMVMGLSACQEAGGGSADASSSGASSAASPTQSATPQAAVTFTPTSGATEVRPDQQVLVEAESGRLTSVTVKNSAGKLLAGDLDATGAAWHSSGVLAADTRYTVTAVATNADGQDTTQTSTFTTLKPTSTAGAIMIPGDDWTVGVGMPVVVQFSRPVKNKDAAVKALHVASSPQVEGAWHWMNNEAVWFRPKTYWPSGTKVRVTANLDSAELASGVWGRRTYTTRFTVGSSVISTVDVKTHKMTVTKDGKVVRVLPITTGIETNPKFRTRGGIKVIMDKKPVENMDAASTGTEKDDPDYYHLTVHWAMRVTWSGEYLHAAPWSVAQQGRANVSHGCTGMSMANAKWMYDFSKIGDVVAYKNSTRPLEPGNGYTAWELSWAKWSNGTGSLTLPLSGNAAATRSGSVAASPGASSASTTPSAKVSAKVSPSTSGSPSLANPALDA